MKLQLRATRNRTRTFWTGAVGGATKFCSVSTRESDEVIIENLENFTPGRYAIAYTGSVPSSFGIIKFTILSLRIYTNKYDKS
ncbi:unnamed protein product [Acanthoscelides obtectus]|uniref:Uncharacterized protein n=1 Tax=Acanthoscelides obtectus TaxID=200917 RepID=A0A9P0QBJ1_ACAOB|nr:unnamed protein product [Acanthoscelides obtectus]CAK1622584.1 hypothetical protein AOBTE_LOCUS1574 [Acanthoscelides obtectus]